MDRRSKHVDRHNVDGAAVFTQAIIAQSHLQAVLLSWI